jgi:Spy/CpxP family protein refolding chaperone
MTRRLWVERLWVGIPATFALATHRMFGQTAQPARLNESQNISKKELLKYSRLKATFRIPKSAAKEEKHIKTLSTLLSLNSDQQQQAASIFNGAVGTRASLHTSLKAARKSLSQAVKNNDSASIGQAAALIANLKAQQLSNGAVANAAFLQILTPEQQATLAEFQS